MGRYYLRKIGKRKIAFTLVEILVTLGIVGVISTLTIPNIISNYQKKVYVTKLQKVHNQVLNAIEAILATEEADSLYETSLYCSNASYDDEVFELCHQRTGDFLKKYFKVAKDCGNDLTNRECLSDGYKNLDGSRSYADTHLGYSYTVVLNSGTVLAAGFSHNVYPFGVFVDLNGKIGPNIVGREAFDFQVNQIGKVGESFATEEEEKARHSATNCPSNPQQYGLGCFNKIIQDGWKMDY